MSNLTVFNSNSVIKDLKFEAKALGLPSGSAELMIQKAVDAAGKKLAKRKIITKNDLERTVGIELQKYNADLAYVYQNRDKII